MADAKFTFGVSAWDMGSATSWILRTLSAFMQLLWDPWLHYPPAYQWGPSRADGDRPMTPCALTVFT